MTIAINATPAFKYPRYGVEEYCYQLIKHLAMLPQARKHRFFLYVPSKLFNALCQEDKSFWHNLPENFYLKCLSFPKMWTQIRLSLQMFFYPSDALFIPVHVLPFYHPKNSVVTIHGLEYEYYPEMYPSGHLRYLRWSTKYSTRNAKKIIAVSETTKNDLVKFYKVPPEKILVVYHGVIRPSVESSKQFLSSSSYILYLGRIEMKKNISGIVRAFEILKQKYQIPHQLILAGSDGWGAEKSRLQVLNSRFSRDIFFTGYVNRQKKIELLKGADLFLFPSFYEGFGLPILEAQSQKVPVVASNVSSMPEVGGQGVALVDPGDVRNIAEVCWQILNDRPTRDKLISRGLDNLLRFSWEKCANQTLRILEG